MSLETLENKRKRMIFRSGHRGTKEMDLIMGSFAMKHVPDFTPEQLDLYDVILEIPDTDLYNWFIGQEEVSEEYAGNNVLALFLAHKVVNG